MSDVKHSITYTIMALPIFLRPLLLIGHYYRLLTRNITGWLEQSNDQYVDHTYMDMADIQTLWTAGTNDCSCRYYWAG
jgi:hypothetical protein